jgi:hypothetical protein
LDPATEPIPLGGRSPRLRILSLVSYLGELVDRVATRSGCDRTQVIALALERPVLQGIGDLPDGRFERRSS